MSDCVVVIQLSDGRIEAVELDEDYAFYEVDENNNLRIGDDEDEGVTYVWNSHLWDGFEVITPLAFEEKYEIL